MEAYLYVFVNCVQNNWVRLLLIAEFTYNNAKNLSINHKLFELNYGYHLHVFFKDKVDPYLRSCLANKLAKELR